MYGEHFSTHVEVEGITSVLCGRSRPSHFRGVTTVVMKLFNISHADRAYFGEKDAQQLAVVKRMAEDLNMDIEIRGCPIVRESDGLAMSSRNKYLSEQERKDAVVLSRALNKGKALLDSGERSAAAITAAIKSEIETVPYAVIDYISVVDSVTLEDIDGEIKAPILAAIAVKIGNTRLIDNFSYVV